MTTFISDKRTMKAMNDPMINRQIRTKRKINRKKAQICLTRKQLEGISCYLIIRTFDQQDYAYYQKDCKDRQNGYYAVNMVTLQTLSLRDLYYHIRNIRLGDSSQIIAKRKQPDLDLLVQPGMQKFLYSFPWP